MMLVTKYNTMNTPKGDKAMNPLLFTIHYSLLQRDAILEYRDFAIVVLFIAGFLAAGHGEHLVDELRHQFLHRTTLYELSCREVHPVGLVLCQRRIRGNLHRRDEGAEGRAATCGEQH